MKILHIFEIDLFKEEEIPRDTLGIWKTKGHLGTLYMYVYSHEKGSKTSPLMLLVDQLMKEDSLSSFALVLQVLRCWSVYY